MPMSQKNAAMTAARRLIAPTLDPAIEGWAIFSAEGSVLNTDGSRPLQLQRWDCPEDADGNPLPPRFESDEAAWAHVCSSAEGGCRMARLALRYLRRFSRPEYYEITGCSSPA